MSIIRTSHNKENPYVMLNKSPLEDDNLSWAAKGLWSYLMSRPDNWNVSVSHLSTIYAKKGGGERAIYSLLNELIEVGYCTRDQPSSDKGQFQKVTYDILEFKTKVPHRSQADALEPHALESPPNNKVVLISKENQQQQPAAVLPKQEKKELKDPINVNLLYINIPDSEKRWISERYDDDTIKHAIEWAQHSETKITSTLEQAIKWACKMKPEIPKEKLSVHDELCKIFKNGQKYNNAECILNPQHLSFHRGETNRYVNLDEYFSWQKVEELCKSFQIKFKRNL